MLLTCDIFDLQGWFWYHIKAENTVILFIPKHPEFSDIWKELLRSSNKLYNRKFIKLILYLYERYVGLFEKLRPHHIITKRT